MAAGVCGTDVHIHEGGKGSAGVEYPIVLGHEYAGIVEEIGEEIGGDTHGFAVGDKVCIDPNVLCGRCYYCLNGMGNFCENMVISGIILDGGFQQYAVVPYRAAYKLQNHVSFQAGAMAEPLACCIHGVDLCEIKSGDAVIIIGGGLIGLLMTQLVKLSGAGYVVLIEPSKEKRDFAKKLGADLCLNPNETNIENAAKNSGITRFGTIIECVGKTQTIELALKIAGKKSTVMMFGLTRPDETVNVYPFDIFAKEITIKSSFINPYTIGRAVSLINNGKVDVTSMIAGSVPLSELENVLTNEELRGKGKFVVDPWK